MRAALAWLVLAGCVRGAAGFHCDTNDQCTQNGMLGVCQSNGFCSFGDPSCASGQRFGGLAGAASNQCVLGDIPDGGVTDARIDARIDALVDAANNGLPSVVSSTTAHAGSVDSLTYPFTVANVPGALLLVAVHLPTDCSTMTVPQTTGVTYDGVALTRIATVLGVACNASARSELWQLTAPAAGTHDVVVRLASATSYTLLSGTVLIQNANQASPTISPSTQQGGGTSASVTVLSQVNDLVLSFIAEGTSITGPSNGTQIYLLNLGTTHTGDNIGASSAPGVQGTVNMGWTFPQDDVWQEIGIDVRHQ